MLAAGGMYTNADGYSRRTTWLKCASSSHDSGKFTGLLYHCAFSSTVMTIWCDDYGFVHETVGKK